MRIQIRYSDYPPYVSDSCNVFLDNMKIGKMNKRNDVWSLTDNVCKFLHTLKWECFRNEFASMADARGKLNEWIADAPYMTKPNFIKTDGGRRDFIINGDWKKIKKEYGLPTPRKGDCGIRALSLTIAYHNDVEPSKDTYALALEYLRLAGKRNKLETIGHALIHFSHGTNSYCFLKALGWFDFKKTGSVKHTDIIPNDFTGVLGLSNHWMFVKEGEVYDTWNSGSPRNSGMRRRVISGYEFI